MEALASDAECVTDAGVFIGTGFDGCWNYNLGNSTEFNTTVSVWKWLPVSNERLNKEDGNELCLFEAENNTVIANFVLKSAVSLAAASLLGMITF